jgi:predicted ATPase
LLPVTILRALAVPPSPVIEPREQLLRFLQDKHLLLLLDNFEHLLEGAGLLPELLAAAPKLKLLATSRLRLDLREEWLAPLAGLELPPGEGALPIWATLEDYSATRLFLQCVRRLRPGYRPADADVPEVVRICRLLDGLPLGLELAAAWTRTLSLPAIAAELARGLDLLATTLRDVPPRQRSLRATFDHSWRLLSARERGILRQLAVFRGGFTREAAAAVAGATLGDLAGLADASWLA